MMENTPLSKVNTQHLRSGAQASKAFAKEKFSQMRQMARDGQMSIRFFALLGGVAMVVVSGFGLVGLTLTFRLVRAVVELYTILMGCVVILLEAGRQVPGLNNMLTTLHTYAMFLKFVWGRGMLYFVAGSLEWTQPIFLHNLVGLYMCVVGIMYIVVGRRVAEKLEALRMALVSEQNLLAAFNKADVDKTGSITLAQFKRMTDELHLDMTRSELESAFLIVDRDDSDRLTFEEFKRWWEASTVTPSQQPASLI